MRIFLVGYMGSGKSTLGRQLAKKLDYDFFDLDHYIEEQNKCSINAFFQQYGETIFRKEEQNCLLELCKKENAVIAVGGGTPCFNDNMEVMNKYGKTVFLNLPVHILIAILKSRKASRPLLANKNDEELADFIKTSHEKRLPFYKMAKHEIQAEDVKIEHLLPYFL